MLLWDFLWLFFFFFLCQQNWYLLPKTVFCKNEHVKPTKTDTPSSTRRQKIIINTALSLSARFDHYDHMVKAGQTGFDNNNNETTKNSKKKKKQWNNKKKYKQLWLRISHSTHTAWSVAGTVELHWLLSSCCCCCCYAYCSIVYWQMLLLLLLHVAVVVFLLL